MIRFLIAWFRWWCRTVPLPGWLEWPLHWLWIRRMSPGRVLWKLARRWVEHRILPQRMHRLRDGWFHQSPLAESWMDDPWRLFDRMDVLTRVAVMPSRDPCICTVILIRDRVVHVGLASTRDEVNAMIDDLPTGVLTDPVISPPVPPWTPPQVIVQQVSDPKPKPTSFDVVMGRRRHRRD